LREPQNCYVFPWLRRVDRKLNMGYNQVCTRRAAGQNHRGVADAGADHRLLDGIGRNSGYSKGGKL
ncbi:MAG: hypothetical protein KAX26_10390, partial [Anaerolineae bacterium]|nr:hypothetical protein [Anaerolineae bacterium]